jgi:hypothetical protein
MPIKNVFICYRRDDAEGYAGRLYDRLNARFPERIFMDVTGIGPGADFTQVIQERVGACSALIAIIGKQWLTIADESSRPRIFLEDDYVRHEIGTALKRGITVIPVLVRDAKMPSAKSLPPDLAALSLRNAVEINDTDFDHDVGTLIHALELEFGERRPVTVAPAKSSKNTCLIVSVIAALLGVAGVVLFVVIALLAPRPTPNNNLYPTPAVSPTEEASPDVEPDEVEFDAVGSWTLQPEGAPMRQFEFQENHTYQADNEQGTWEYSPNNRTLKLQGQFYDTNTDTTRPITAQIVIVRRDGNQFIGHVSSEGYENTVRLTPR